MDADDRCECSFSYGTEESPGMKVERECTYHGNIRERAEQAEAEMNRWLDKHPRCARGHHAKFTYTLKGKEGCVACEKEQAEAALEEANAELRSCRMRYNEAMEAFSDD